MSQAIQDFFAVRSPPIAAVLGWKLIEYDQANRSIEISFDAKPEFTNPAGNIQGGILVAMMDDSMGPALVVASNATHAPSSVDIHTHFLRPVKPGRISVKARVTQLGRRMAFLEAELFDDQQRLCARATSSAMLVELHA